ncbi:MAG: phospholipid carrier-dependent glycosyltransferase [Candidatus Andersenbacteria bacterium]|nr:phospholipid carrier-dependent glycosyltransferase [Candidatus Andersenbacteria bacterium]MBI3250240.1 phospholipid carrier-dependent glycosyltransferase [Candidatus Andersenbacteria bacterium]
MKNIVLGISIGIALGFALFTPRLFSLGQVLTIDEPLWIDRGAVFVQRVATLQFAESVPALQPGVTTAWISGSVARFGSLAVSQSSIAVVTALLILLSGYFLSRLWPPFWAWSATFLLALDPFLIGHSRVVHTDALLGLFLLTSTLSLLVYLERTGQEKKITDKRYAAFSGILLGLAVLTKVFALAIIPAHAIIILFYVRTQRLPLSRIILSFTLWLLTAVATLFFVWPALWVNVADTVHAMYDGISQYEDGTRTGEVTDQWWYYIRESAVRLSPFALIFLPFSLLAIWRNRHTRMGRTAGVLLLTGVLYAVILSLRGERSVRYILFSLLTITVSGLVGLQLLLDWSQKRWHLNVEKARLGAIIFILLSLFIIDARLHPYYLSYVNPFYPLEADHKLGWGQGLEQAARWVEEHDPNRSVATYYPRVFKYFYNGHGSVESLAHIPENTPSFVVLYRSMFERSADSPESDLIHIYLDQQTPVHTVTINGLPMVWIFENKP